MIVISDRNKILMKKVKKDFIRMHINTISLLSKIYQTCVKIKITSSQKLYFFIAIYIYMYMIEGKNVITCITPPVWSRSGYSYFSSVYVLSKEKTKTKNKKNEN